MNHYVYLPLAEISINGGTQARAEINMATVAEYADALSEGETLPPALVFFDGAKHHLADGFHRYHANAKIGATSMECEVRTGMLLDARLYAYGANQGHGLRRSNDDKRKAVLGMLSDFGDWSDNRIAKHVGVDHKTVAAHRPSILGNSQDAPTTRTVERNGKTYAQDTAGQKKAGKEKAKKPAAVEPKTPEPAPATKAAPADETADAADDEAPAAAAAGDPRDAQIEELAKSLRDAVDDNIAMGKVFESDDKLAAAMAANKQLRAEVAGLRERVNGLMGEKNAAIQRVKSLMAKLKKAGLE